MRRSKTLDGILIFQISSSNKTELGYDKGMNSEQSYPTVQDGNKKSYVDVVKYPVEKGDSKNSYSFQSEMRTNKMERSLVTNINLQFWVIDMFVKKLDIKHLIVG